MEVKKTDGSFEEFIPEKIEKSICDAFSSVNDKCNEGLLRILTKNLFVYDKISTQEIRRQVEENLMSINKKAAKAYIQKYDDRKHLKKDEDFIKQYINASNASTGSKYDSNANVGNKNVVTLGQELHKGKNIQQNRYIMHNKIKALYSKKLADQYIKDLESHVLYKHDESGTPGYPYTYSSKEVVEVLYNGKNLLLPLDLLYQIVDEKEHLVDNENIVYQKVPWHLYVKDNEGKYTKITKLTKKKRHRPLVRVKTAFGEDLVVTDNHPMITDINDIENTVEAKDSLGCTQYRVGDKLSFKGNDKIDFKDLLPSWVEIDESFIKYQQATLKRYIDVNRKLGYVIGFFVGDGNFNNTSKTLVFTQGEKTVLEKLNNLIYDIFGITGKIQHSKGYNKEKYVLILSNLYVYELFRGYFKIQDKAQNKTLPYNILEFNEEFAKGCLEGLIDSDGTIKDNGSAISIRLASRACILQCTQLFRYFNYNVGNTKQSLPFGNNSSFKTNYTIWGISATKKPDSVLLNESEKVNKHLIDAKSNNLKYKNSGYVNITSVEEIEEESAFYDLNDFIYDITTETHTFSCNNILVHNCVAITMYPFLIDGLTKLGGQSTAPTDLKSYCGEFINLVYSISSQFMGAVATPEYLMYMDYFIRKDYGDDYLDKLDVKVDLSRKERTLEEVIENCFQQVVHSMNMPAGNRGYQSVFWNVGYFDKNYFDGVFGDFVFPDGTKPKWETLSWLQKKFMKWFNEERTKYILTFPVETMAMLTDGHDIVDKEYADFTSEMWAEGHSFFCYLSDSPDSLSSCCFDKDQKVLWKSSTLGVKLTTLEELHNSKWGADKKNLRIFHNGSWVRGKSIKLPNREMYKITTLNNKVFLMTDNHINLTLEGEKETKELTTNDYLMFNTQKLSAVPENDENLTYEQGFVVGTFLGDGEVYNNVYPLRISSRKLASFIMKWTLWERGTYAYNKKLNLNCLLQSEEFRRGILDGWYNTDGGNTNRCYTTSKELAEDMEVLITSLGMQSIINVSDKTEESVIIRGEEYNRNYPLYCVKWYAESNNRANKGKEKAWVKKNNSIFFKVKSIEKVDYTEDVYCIECANEEEPYFTLPCGLITHNCRLRNSLKDGNLDEEHNHTTHQFSMGTASVATGSKSVMTINLNRVIQDATRKYAKEVENVEISDGAQFEVKKAVYKEKLYEYISNEITSLTERVHKYQRAFNEILKDFYNSNMLDVYSAGFISLKKQYLTVGVNGLTDAAEFLGLEANLNEEYNYFVNVILETINKSNKKDRTKECMYNTEFVPGENLSNKNYNWDKKDGYYVSPKHVMYSSYFFNPEDSSLSVLDKMKLHGENFVKYLDGGQAAHLNLNEHLSFNQYRELLKVASQNGCSYFTFNVKNSVCNDCGHISKDTLDTCPKCGSHNIDYLTRIIGYLSRVSSFAEARQVEEKMRYYS